MTEQEYKDKLAEILPRDNLSFVISLALVKAYDDLLRLDCMRICDKERQERKNYIEKLTTFADKLKELAE